MLEIINHIRFVGRMVLVTAICAMPAVASAQTSPPPVSPPGRNVAPDDKGRKDEPRPTTPAPQPARPDPEAQKSGARPALPPAPPEKIGEPIDKNEPIDKK